MAELRFDGRVALVTGSGRGLGREYALLLAARGAAVIVNDLGGGTDGSGGSPDPANDVVKEILAGGGVAVANTNSVTSPEGAAAMVGQAVETFGHLDIVINNAGTLVPAPFPETGLETFQRIFDVNFYGTVNVLHAAWPHLLEADHARVVNTVSGSLLGFANLTAYASAKGAALSLTRTLALEAAGTGIAVNAIAPGGFTRLSALQSGDGDSLLSEEAMKVMEQMMAPALNAPVGVFLAHESCPLNGEVLNSTGGRVTRLFLAETEALVDPQLSLESMAAGLDGVMDTGGYHVLTNAQDQINLMLPAIVQAAS